MRKLVWVLAFLGWAVAMPALACNIVPGKAPTAADCAQPSVLVNPSTGALLGTIAAPLPMMDSVIDGAQHVDSVSSAAVGYTFSTAGAGEVSFQVDANASGNTIVVEGSNDAVGTACASATNWNSIWLRRADASGQGFASNNSTTTQFMTPNVRPACMRWRVSSYAGGTTTIGTSLKRSGAPNATDVNVLNSTLTAVPNAGATTTPTGLARINSAASTNTTLLKSSSGRIFPGEVCNMAAYDVFLKLYNKASAPTVGTDTPAFTLPVKAGTCNLVNVGAFGAPFATGIAYAITKLQADSDTTSVAAGDLVGFLSWQ